MSFIGDFLGTSLEKQLEREFSEFLIKIGKRIEAENQQLIAAGLELPTVTSNFSYTFEKEKYDNGYHCLRVKLISPKFNYPGHKSFAIVRDKLALTVLGDPVQLQGNFQIFGLGELARRVYSPIWTNRVPYEMFEELSREYSSVCTYTGKGSLTTYTDSNVISARSKGRPELRAVEGVSRHNASRINLRVKLYADVTDAWNDLFNQDSKTHFGSYGSPLIDPSIVLDLSVPSVVESSDQSCLKIIPSGEIKSSRMVEFLNSLSLAVSSFISFELVKEEETVYYRIRSRSKVTDKIIQNLKIYFPDYEVSEEGTLESPPIYYVSNVRKYYYKDKIRELKGFPFDPFTHFARFFEEAEPEEKLCYQVRFAPLKNESAQALASHLRYKFPDEPERSKHLLNALPLWFAGLQINGTNQARVEAFAKQAGNTFSTPEQKLENSKSFYLQNSTFPEGTFLGTGIYGTEELAALMHFPISALPIEKLESLTMKSVAPPASYTTGEVLIGSTRSRGKEMPVTIPDSVRDRHVYIVGKSGTGKSTVIETIARHEIELGGGLAVIDPHGDMINHLLKVIPEHRVADCIYFSPKDCPLSLEILSAETEHEIDLLSDDLITMFRRTSESWGDKMQAILQMAFHTLLRVPGSSFTDITRLLTDEGYRNAILAKIDHPQMVNFWNHRYDVRQAEPILIRMDRLTTSSTMRKVFTQSKNSVNFSDVISDGKIFLADLSKGFLGESTSHLLGSIIVSQIQLAAMRQAHLPAEQRVPFSLFVDEVQNFTTDAFSTILSEARKQKLRLTIAHQFVSQLPTEIQKAVFGNVGTMIFFALSPDDLGAARHELGSFEPSDVANLPKYQALCRPATAAKDTFMFSTVPPPNPPAQDFTQMIVEETRRQYGSLSGIPEPAQASPAPLREPAPAPQVGHPTRPRLPADAEPLSFDTNTEKILHFIRQAEYLSQPQIIALTGLQPSNASTALKKLVDTGQIKSLDDRRPKIYFIGKTCNPTTHNLLLRDLFVKIHASNFAIRQVKFNDTLSDLNPDLAVEFLGSDAQALFAYFELDRGTEGVQELVTKAQRYTKVAENARIGFVFEREVDAAAAIKAIPYRFVQYSVLNSFTSLRDEAFSGADAPEARTPFFN